MGCGASTDVGGLAYAVGANDDAIAAAFDSQSAHADLPHDAFDRPATAAELEAWEAVNDDAASVASGGAAADEPSAMALSLRVAKAVLVARVSHGINGDVHQFAAEREPPMAVYRSVVVVDTWLRTQAWAQQACSITTHSTSFMTAARGGADVSPVTPLIGGGDSSVAAIISVGNDAISLHSLNESATPPMLVIPDDRDDDAGLSPLLRGPGDSDRRLSATAGPLTIQLLSKHEQMLKAQPHRCRESSRV